MNLFIGIGRLTRDPEVRRNGDKANASYTLAVNRRNKQEGQPDADFFRCVAFGKNADFVEKYLRKGTKILVRGELRTGSYEKDGQKHYTTDIWVNEHEFVEGKASSEAQPQEEALAFTPIPDGYDEDLPFA